MIFLGTQSYGSLTEPLDQPGCKLEMANKPADKWGPQTREREGISLKIKMEKVYALGLWAVNYVGAH